VILLNIPAISSGYPSTDTRPNQSFGVDAKIKSLEQKLQKLNTARQKAIQRKDEEEKKKIEKQIQEIENQIQQLRQQEKERTKEPGNDESNAKEASQNSTDIGKYIDVYA
jgi:chromosome segregation ATPase